MKRLYRHSLLKKITAFILCISFIFTSINLPQVFVEAEDLPEHELLDGYFFDVEVPLGANFNKPDYLGITTIDNVVINCGNFEPITTSMTITGSGRNKGLITGVPVYIIKGTGKRSENGSEEYLTSPGFYSITVPPAIENDFYTLYFDGATTTVDLVTDVNPNDLLWYVNTKEKLNVVERETVSHSYKTSFLSDNEIKTYPDELKNANMLFYTENGNTTYFDITHNGNVSDLGNSAFEIKYLKVPTTSDIDPSVTYVVPAYNTTKNGENISYQIYNGDNIIYDGFSQNVADGSEIKYFENGTGYTEVKAASTSEIKYIENTSVKGSIIWMDGEEPDLRLSADTIKGMIDVYASGGERGLGVKLEPDKYYKDHYDIDINYSDNQMDVLISGLPLYDSKGNALHYYYKLRDDIFSANDPEYSYTARYNNGTASSSTSQAYDGAKIYLQLTQKTTEYNISFEWQDDEYNNPGNSKRQELIAHDSDKIAFYLWRYAGKDILSNPYEKASPVYNSNGDQYYISLNTIGDKALDTLFDYDISKLWELPKYNENGQTYHYYFTVVDNSRDYDVSVDSGKTFIVENDKVYITRVGTDSKYVRVSWTQALGEVDYVGTKSRVQLQRRLRDTDDEWKNIEDCLGETQAASNGHPSVGYTFESVDLYDEKGRTYEFRAIETDLIPSGSSEVSIAGPWKENEDGNEAVTTATFKKHSYTITSSYEEEEDSRSLLTISHKLKEDIDFTLNITWGSDFRINATDYMEVLNRLMEQDGEYFTKPVSYTIIQKFGDATVDYAKLTVNGKDESGYKVLVEYLNDDTRENYEISMTPTIDKTNILWKFYNIVLPKYNGEGRRYAYSIKGEEDGVSSDNEHDQLKEYLNTLETFQGDGNALLGFSMDRSSDTVHNSYSIVHSLTVPGVPYSIEVEADWKDSLSDPSERVVKAHILALVKDDTTGEYYLAKDLSEGDEPRASELVLNAANEFKLRRYFSPYLDSRNGKNEIEELKNSISSDYIKGLINDEKSLIYVAVEHSLSYKEDIYKTSEDENIREACIYYFPYVDDSGKVNTDFIFGNTTDVDYNQPVRVDENNSLLMINYPYDISIVNKNKYISVGGNNVSEKIITHSLSDLKGDVSVSVNWRDDNNSSGYRREGYRLVLYRNKSSGDVDTDFNQEPIDIKWDDYGESTPDSLEDLMFRDLPLYDDEGRPYNYQIRQYIIYDDNGTQKLSEIEHTATAYTTTNFYYDVLSSNTSAKVTNGVYKEYKKFEVTNIATNLDYKTQFYVVWHDEAAYNADARVDMNYALYYTTNIDPDTMHFVNSDDYSAVVYTADSPIQNPFFQKIEFSNLVEFDSGIKYNYFLKETKTATTENLYNYEINYYRQNQLKDGEKLRQGDNVKSSSGDNKLYYHREFENSLNPDDVDCIGEYEVIINSIEDIINVKGTKKWVNVSDSATKPECSVYLYRESLHDSAKSKPDMGKYSSMEERPTGGSYIAVTELDKDKAGFAFLKIPGDESSGYEEYQKYDKYGSVYNYEIAEYIRSDDERPVKASIMAGTSDGSQLLTNIFDPEKNNRRSISVSKKWLKADGTEFSSADFINKPKPFARFRLYRMECNYMVDDSNPEAEAVSYERVKAEIEKEVSAGKASSIEAYLANIKYAELIDTFYLGYDDKSIKLDDLNIYAPSGKAYVYFVVEDKDYVSSYNVDNLGASDDEGANDGENGYKVSDNIAIVSNADMTLDPSLGQMFLSLFTDINKSNVTFTNTLKDNETFIKINGSIKWNEGITAIKSDARPNIEDAKKYITLSVSRQAVTQESKKNPETQEQLSKYGNGQNEERIIWTEDPDDKNIWHYEITKYVSTGEEHEFAKYSKNGNPYAYKVSLEYVNTAGANVGANYSISNNNPTRNSTAESGGVLSITTQIQNTLRGTYVASKIWNDGYDTYGLRPKKVICMFEYQDKDGNNWIPLRYSEDEEELAGKVITVELSKASGWKANLTRFPTQYLGESDNYKYRLVELGIQYASGKILPVTDFSDFSGESTYIPGVSGIYGALVESKPNWDYSNEDSSQYQYMIQNVGTEYEPNYVYRSKLSFGSYQVEPANIKVNEVGKTATTNPEIFTSENGYSNQSYVTSKDKTISGLHQVKNVLSSKLEYTLIKKWDDDKNSFGSRPDNIWVEVQKRIDKIPTNETDTHGNIIYKERESFNKDEIEALGPLYNWTNVKRVSLNKADAINEDTSDTWEFKLEDLPEIDGDNNKVAYRILECSKTYVNGQEQFNIIDVDDSNKLISDNTSIDNYNLTNYEYNGNAKSISLTNTLNALKKNDTNTVITVNKKWALPSDEISGHSVNIKTTATYEDGNILSSTVELNEDNNFTHDWNSIPAFIVDENGVKQSLTATKASEIEIDGEAIDDSKWLVETNRDGDTVTIINTPYTSHSFVGEYTGDDTQNTKYATRQSSSRLKLQRSIDNGANWEDANGYTDITGESDDEWASYTCSVDKLPKYVITDDGVAKYDYRIVEVKSDELDVSYQPGTLAPTNTTAGDSSVGGYLYEYTVSQEDKLTTLKKTLVTTAVEGEKIWADVSNRFLTRPTKPTGSSSEDIALDIYKGTNIAPEAIDITWEESGDNKWTYRTDSVLPKYKSHTNTLEKYSVKETTVDKEYKESISGLNVTNTLQTVSLPIKKIWEDAELCERFGVAQKNVTYTVQKSTDGVTYTDLTDKDGNAITRTLSYSDTGETQDIISNLPKVSADGIEFSYRIIETGMVVTFKGQDVDVSYTLKPSSNNQKYEVWEKVGNETETKVPDADILISNLSGNASYSYNIGIFNASYSYGEDTSDVYQYTNTIKSASLSAVIRWEEKLVGQSTLNTTLISKFRPSSADYVIQRRIAGSDSEWSDVTNALTGKDVLTINVTASVNEYSISSEQTGGKLPIYLVDGGEVKRYEYRIVEKEFSYGSSDSDKKPLNYDIDNSGNTISSDYTGNNLACDDLSDGKVFYKASQSLAPVPPALGDVYIASITNRLQTVLLVNEVMTKLSGSILWKDNKNELNKRPDDTGITMMLRAQIPNDDALKDLSKVEIVIGNSSSGTSGNLEFDTKIEGHSTNATVNWTKDESNNTGEWKYSITGLPLYDSKGNYITYSLAQKSDVTDYNGKAFATDESKGHVSDANQKYAFGTVTDIKNDYSATTGKKVENVDFYEDMTTTFTVTKKWNDNNNKWDTRPESLNLFIQSREVELVSDTEVSAKSGSNWHAAFAPVEDFDKNLVENEGNKNYVSVSAPDTKPTPENDVEWVYTDVYPQYKIDSSDNYTLLEYRAVEVGQKKNNGDYVLLDTPVTTHIGVGLWEDVAHVSSYVLREYSYDNWNRGYSSTRILNDLDKREDITIKKEWNTDDAVLPESVTVEVLGVIDEKETEVATVKEIFREELNGANNWTFTYENLPKYDLHFNEIIWEAREVSVGANEVTETKLLSDDKAGISADGKWLATYEKEYKDSEDPKESDDLTLIVTNTPATGTTLSVEYVDDLDNAFDTRFTQTKAILQYRTMANGVDAAGEWQSLPEALAKLVNVKNTVDSNSISKESANGVVISNQNTEAESQYSYRLTNLPIYAGYGLDRGAKLEYRIIEVSQGALDEKYDDNTAVVGMPKTGPKLQTIEKTGDRASGGYLFDYSKVLASVNERDLKLDKTLLKTTLSGQKIWDDSSNAYGTRAVQSVGVQADDSPVKISVSEETMGDIDNITVTWSATDTDNWSYITSKLPKYNPKNNILGNYVTTENYEDTRYITEYESKDNQTLASNAYIKETVAFGEKGDTKSTMSDITNELESYKMIAKKVWYNDNNNEPECDVTFKLLRSVNGGEYETITDGASGYSSKVLNTSVAEQSINWDKLPKTSATGDTYKYHIVEDTPESYSSIMGEPKESGDTTTTTFTNIKLQNYTISKKWKDTVRGTETDTDGNYRSKVVLQKSIDGGAWVDTEQTGEIVFSYDDTVSSNPTLNKKSVVFKDLPMFTPQGKSISYRGKETEINGKIAADNKAYAIEYDYDTYSKETLITNSLNEVRIHVEKTDETDGAYMPGVVFDLYWINSATGDEEFVAQKVINESGNLQYDVLRQGKYVLREEKVMGYEKPDDVIFTITSNDYHKDKVIEVKNKRVLATLNINKIDEDTGESIDNTVFDIYKENEGGVFENIWNFITGNRYEKIESVPAKESGRTEIKGIPWGHYYIVESRASDGYIITDNKYYFDVDSTNCESPIELKLSGNKITDNTITNKKNSFSFQKRSFGSDRTEVILREGKYILNNITTGESEEFTIPSDSDFVSFVGKKKGDYIVKEIKAPEGYAINSNGVKFTITEKGEIKYRDSILSGEWPDKRVLLYDMPIASFTVTKRFEGDELWKKSIRPNSVKLQLYRYKYDDGKGASVKEGTPVDISINNEEDVYTYTYTYKNLPMYDDNGDALCYYAEEINDSDSLYDVSYSSVAIEGGGDLVPALPGAKYSQTITNKAPDVKSFYVTKNNINGPKKAKFTFKVSIGKTKNSLKEYKDIQPYQVGTYDELSDVLADDRTVTPTRPVFTISSDETFEIKVPENAYVRLEEIAENDPPEYAATYITDADTEGVKEPVTLREDETKRVVVENEKLIYTKIENTTDVSDSVIEKDSPSPGGQIAVIKKDGNKDNILEESNSDISYKEGAFGVFWSPNENWAIASSFTVKYNETTGDDRGDAQKIIEVRDFLEYRDGKVVLKDRTESCYDELRARYNEFEIEYDEKLQRIILYLSDKEEGLPYTNEVNVGFLPTVAAINITDDFAGGSVKVESGIYRNNSDGKGENGDSRYINQTVVYAKADRGYCIDLSNILIENVGEIEYGTASKAQARLNSMDVVEAAGLPIKVSDDNTFTKDIVYKISDTSYAFRISGKIEISKLDKNDNPSEIKLVLDSLPIPIDVGIKFIESKSDTPKDDPGDDDDKDNPNKDKPNKDDPNKDKPNRNDSNKVNKPQENSDVEKIINYIRSPKTLLADVMENSSGFILYVFIFVTVVALGLAITLPITIGKRKKK